MPAWGSCPAGSSAGPASLHSSAWPHLRHGRVSTGSASSPSRARRPTRSQRALLLGQAALHRRVAALGASARARAFHRSPACRPAPWPAPARPSRLAQPRQLASQAAQSLAVGAGVGPGGASPTGAARPRAGRVAALTGHPRPGWLQWPVPAGRPPAAIALRRPVADMSCSRPSARCRWRQAPASVSPNSPCCSDRSAASSAA
jgi:hypothetical protein